MVAQPSPPRVRLRSTLANRGQPYARQRLALARVVLEAGFAGDAVKASYEALAAAIGGLLSEAPASHAELVAAIFSKLLPGGRLPAGAHGSLAKLHDLSLLEAWRGHRRRRPRVQPSPRLVNGFDRIGASPSFGSASAAATAPNA